MLYNKFFYKEEILDWVKSVYKRP